MKKQFENHLKIFLKFSWIINLICLFCFRLMKKQVIKHSLKTFLKPSRIINLTCLVCFRLMKKQLIEYLLKTSLKSSRIINLICLFCFRLMKKQIAEHQFQRVSIFQNNHSTKALTVFIHHHLLACLLCSRLMKEQIIEHPLKTFLKSLWIINLTCLLCFRLVRKQIIEHPLKASLGSPRIINLICLFCFRLVEKQIVKYQFQKISTPQKNIKFPFEIHDHWHWTCHSSCFIWRVRTGQKYSLLIKNPSLPFWKNQKNQIFWTKCFMKRFSCCKTFLFFFIYYIQFTMFSSNFWF